MLEKTVPEIYNFKHDRAFELLKLTEEAHRRYDDLYPRLKKEKRKFDHITPANKEWLNGKWKIDFDDLIKTDNAIGKVSYEEYKDITSLPYQVLAHLVFTQTVWSITDIRNRFKRENLFGFIAKHSETSDLYVVFRGTSNLGEWISNVKLIQQSYTKVDSCNAAGETHWGFRRTYDRPEPKTNKVLWATRWFDQTFLNGASSIRETVETTLKEQCPSNAEKVKIYVTGHSLGGALATLATAHIKQLIDQGVISAHYPTLYSFASPRVGDSDFAIAFDEIECYRVANSEDLVPNIPLPTLLPMAGRLPARSGILQGVTDWLDKSLNYQHVGVPIYFTLQKSSISDNHTLPVYFEALTPPKLP